MASKAETLAWQAVYKRTVEDSPYHKRIAACADRQTKAGGGKRWQQWSDPAQVTKEVNSSFEDRTPS